MDTIRLVEVSGRPVIFDRSIQIAGSPHVFVWDIQDSEIAKYIASVVRGKLTLIEDEEQFEHEIAHYNLWKRDRSDVWLREQTAYYESRKILDEKLKGEKEARHRQIAETLRFESLTPAERHKERLERYGIEYRGIRDAKQRLAYKRSAHCYACKQPLDSSTDLQCIACGWMLCRCGACGCTFFYI